MHPSPNLRIIKLDVRIKNIVWQNEFYCYLRRNFECIEMVDADYRKTSLFLVRLYSNEAVLK